MRPDRPFHRRLLGALRRPEYLFHPQQVCRRLCSHPLVGADRIRLAWDLPITADPGCYVGRDIINLGVFDKVVPEAIFRLLDRGEIGVDAGSHIGQNTSAMAIAAGPGGQVHAIEPHPLTAARLTRNVDRWRTLGLQNITVHQVALGASPGVASLHEPEDFGENSGSATLLMDRTAGSSHLVRVAILDELLGAHSTIGLLKLDVEGVEVEVLEGATRLLAASAIRDIVFEDYANQPSALRNRLEQAGYAVVHLAESWSGPSLEPGNPASSGANYLATLDPHRATERYRPRGWRVLRRRYGR